MQTQESKADRKVTDDSDLDTKLTHKSKHKPEYSFSTSVGEGIQTFKDSNNKISIDNSEVNIFLSHTHTHTQPSRYNMISISYLYQRYCKYFKNRTK